jgi:hypothetical protein
MSLPLLCCHRFSALPLPLPAFAIVVACPPFACCRACTLRVAPLPSPVPCGPSALALTLRSSRHCTCLHVWHPVCTCSRR